MVPASADCGYLNVEKYFEENYSSKVPIIADPDIARYVHLAVRNPTPSELIWSYPSNSTFCYASSIYSEAFVVTRYDIASMNSIMHFKLYFGREHQRGGIIYIHIQDKF
ncbi:MAG: hypothetical protein ACP5O5_07455 [Fervidicoccaceae archaeon]